MSRRNRNAPQFNRKAGQPTSVSIDLSSADDVVCDSCGNYTFVPVMLMKRLSAILSPTGQEAIIPMQVFSCNACGWINKEFLPTKEQGEEPTDEQETGKIIV